MGPQGPTLRSPEQSPLILLDTNALIWLHQGHRRSRPLARTTSRLRISPASLLEIQFLVEAGRIRLRARAAVAGMVEDERWLLDDPPSGRWFEAALEAGWTRDPFDRLVVAHTRLRGWRLATGDRALLDRLGAADSLER